MIRWNGPSAAFVLVVAASAVAAQASPDSSVGQATADSAIVLAAGDIASCSNGAPSTAKLLDTLQGQIIVIGDAAYRSSRDPNPYLTCYDSTWGRHKSRTRVAMGNHDYEPRHMRQFFDYFGPAAGPRPGGYYSFTAGSWLVITLNSNLDMGPRSPQGRWLARQLAANSAKCTMAVMHHPRFSSGPHSPLWTTRVVFPTLDSAGVDVLLTAHDHIYERFAQMDREGKRDENGVRQFIVGTGGSGLYSIERATSNSEARTDDNFGILKLTLRAENYSWEFIPVRPDGFRDSGTDTCR